MKKMFLTALFSAMVAAAAVAQSQAPFVACKTTSLTKAQVLAKGGIVGEIKPVNYAKAPANLAITFVEEGGKVIVNISDNVALQVLQGKYHYGDVIVTNMPRVKGCKFEITTTKGKIFVNVAGRSNHTSFHFSARGQSQLNGASYSTTLVLEKK